MSAKRPLAEDESSDDSTPLHNTIVKKRTKRGELLSSVMRTSVITLSIAENPSRDGAVRLKRINQKALFTVKEKLTSAFQLQRSENSERETKAQQAMKCALKLMSQYRINPEDIMKMSTDLSVPNFQEKERHFVEIKGSLNTMGRNRHWINLLSFGIGILFDTEHFSVCSTALSKSLWTFCGEGGVTRAAVINLEMAYTRIMTESDKQMYKFVYRTSAADAIFDYGVAELTEEVRIMLERATNSNNMEETDREESSNPPTVIHIYNDGPAVVSDSDEGDSDLEYEEIYNFSNDDDEEYITRSSSSYQQPNHAVKKHRSRLHLPQIQVLKPMVIDKSKNVKIDDNWMNRKKALLNKIIRLERPYPACDTWLHWEAYYQAQWDALELWLELKDLAAKIKNSV